MEARQPWPALEKDDAGLKKVLEQLLAGRAVGDPYSGDGSFAAHIARRPTGLRVMAATHWLDISLTLDSPGLLDNLGPGESVIYQAWIRYTRLHPAATQQRPDPSSLDVGEMKPWPFRIEKCPWMYTEPYRKAQNGNPVS